MTSVRSAIFILLAVIIISVLWGCSHKTLTVFFDGVPENSDSLRMAAKAGKKPDSLLVAQLAANAAASGHSDHPPFINKKCSLCHDQGRKGKLVQPMPGLCYQCHEAYEEKFEHGPVASGNCTQCHSPHTAENPKLLLRTGASLCTGCHEPSGLSVRAEHENPEELICIKCHNPHGGKKRYFLN